MTNFNVDLNIHALSSAAFYCFVCSVVHKLADVTFDQLCLECPFEAGGGAEERSSMFRQGKNKKLIPQMRLTFELQPGNQLS